ncbi:NADPH-dependent FMN reductase [Nitratireductor indicus]|uniref:NADPH-dependent FMN reductase n=1 Tax=Nitratireductor indicus C115 TaxID=1231190 RepID=K2NQN7_9HYPH|nr:NAD(P)H-dependent oxidoreductase [Nitratireductor indicus]EKF41680.1 NADPH-dependent FMN reductase [Nitratireductor indicus C115]MDS1137038.1 NAD(P)H-dependent oxidoreductase [Nitratireductor indicus]SFQ68356.1 NAD(P)H-dependent FMN reductase [Nitratireductor indicus]
MIPRILVFAGSTRTGAFSGRTADAATKELAEQGAEVTRISLADYPLPIMDQDLEKEKGIPESALKLGGLIAAHDGVLIASPEYNASIPPLLKNTVDWVSRISKIDGRPVRPWAGKVVGLCSSSDGNFAGIRGLYHLRAVLMNCRAEIVTPQCSVARAQDAFDEEGNFKDERTRGMMEGVCRAVIEHARLLSNRVEA